MSAAGFTIAELIERLNDLPSEWLVGGCTTTGSLYVTDGSLAIGQQYGYVFTDGRPTRIMRRRS